MEKICSKCKQKKDINYFGKLKESKDGHRCDCKECRKLEYLSNKKKINIYYHEYYKNHSKEIKEKVNKFRLNNPEAIKERKKIVYYKNREFFAEKSKKYREKNQEKIKNTKGIYRATHKEQRNKKEKTKRDTNPNYRLMVNLRNRLRSALKRDTKSGPTLKLLGCTIDKFKKYLESKFDSNMNWDNYGTYWEIDHILPCRAFNLKNQVEQERCFHFSNLQPMSATENSAKQDLLPNGLRARDG